MLPVALQIVNSDKILVYKDNTFSIENDIVYDYISLDLSRHFNRHFSGICYDISTLLKLKGNKFDSFNEIIKTVFVDAETTAYFKALAIFMAYIKSYKVTNININEFDIIKTIPEDVWLSYYKEKIFLIKRLYDDFIESEYMLKVFYKGNFYYKCELLHNLSKQDLLVDKDFVLSDIESNSYVLNHIKSDDKLKLKFNFVGAKTGRIGFKKNSFNLYNLPRELRKAIIPRSGFKIVEFDFKNFQPRLAINAVLDENFKEKFKEVEDIYSVFNGDREANKIELISWMYSNQRNSKFEEEAHAIKELRKYLFNLIKQNGYVVNTFGRPLYIDSHTEEHVIFQNYITSLEVDSILYLIEELNKDNKLLAESDRFRIMFPFHDAIVCEIKEDSLFLCDDIKNTLEDRMKKLLKSYFPVNIKVGDNYGSLTKW